MKKLGSVGIVVAVIVAAFQLAGFKAADLSPSAAQPSVSGATAEVLGVYFTPPAGAAQAIVRTVDASRQEVLVQAYGFTHNAIAQSLVRAQTRGVRVRVLLDAQSDKTNRYVIDLFRDAALPVKFDGAHAIAHNKVMVIDASVVVTGSYNFTNSADSRNAENILVLRSTELARRYRENWQTHWSHGQPAP